MRDEVPTDKETVTIRLAQPAIRCHERWGLNPYRLEAKALLHEGRHIDEYLMALELEPE